jgi:hypothetical protein
MSSLSISLRNVIYKDFVVECSGCGKSYYLNEPKENASVVIKINKNDDVFCFSLDKDRDKGFPGDRVFPFLNPDTKGLCAKNDFILVYRKNDLINVLLVELKGCNSGNYLNQLKSGKTVFDFIVQRINLCGGLDLGKLTEDNISYRGVVFRKRETADKSTSTRQKPLDFNTDNLPFPVTHQFYSDEPYYVSKFFK